MSQLLKYSGTLVDQNLLMALLKVTEAAVQGC